MNTSVDYDACIEFLTAVASQSADARKVLGVIAGMLASISECADERVRCDPMLLEHLAVDFGDAGHCQHPRFLAFKAQHNAICNHKAGVPS